MKQRLKRIVALVLSASLALPMSSLPSLAAERTNTIFTEPETVQVNDLGKERSTLFNSGWKFFLGNSSSAQDPNFNDSDWRSVDLPHDYSIEQDFTVKGEAESGFLLGGTGWYRKSFTLPEDCSGKNMTIDFNGVYMNATVYVNGQKLGTHPYGYTGFAFDISDYVVCDGRTQNVIAVKVDHKVPSSRWYSGSGIYRDVYFNVTDPVHVSRYGTTITTPNLESQKDGNVSVHIKTAVENEKNYPADITVKNTVCDKSGNPVSDPVTKDITVMESGSAELEQTATVNKPELWSVDSPSLYYVKTEILMNNEVIDTYESEFGFRYIRADNQTGFYLNGQKTKLKGVCMHHDQGSLGAKAYEDAIERQVKILKEMGCNSIRVTHNPASDVLVRLCDQYGILLIDEAFDTWLYAKNGNSNDYSVAFAENIEADNQIIGGNSEMTWAEYDMKEMVSRGKNSPGMIMWSLGNEIMEGNSGDFSIYPAITQQLIDWGKEIDDTRFYTFGDNKLKQNWSEAYAIADILTAEGGMVGANYCGDGQYSSIHSKLPESPLYGAETASAIGSRGVYNTKGQNNTEKELTAYDKTHVGWGATASSAWFDVIRNDYNAGTYVWTGFDYIGEPTPWNGTGTGSGTGGPFPKSSYFGIVDTAGFPKDDYYLYQSLWSDDVNTLHVLPCWDEENIVLDDGRAEVVVYTDAAKVELYLNDKKVDEATSIVKTTSAGYTYRMWQGKTNASGLYPTFNVTYEPGTLYAKAFDESGREIKGTVGRSSVTTSSTPSSLKLTDSYSYGDYSTIQADGYSLSYISVDVLDENGVPDPDAKDAITFTLTGDGELVGTDNGEQKDTTCYVPTSTTETVRRAYSGKALAIVKSTTKAGSFTLTASASGLSSDSITITTTPVSNDETPDIQSYRLSKHCYVKQGAKDLTLPDNVSVTYADETKKELPVIWDEIDPSYLNKPGNFVVSGSLTDDTQEIKVSITVHIYGNVVAAQNYSGITAPNTMPELPNVMNTYLESGYSYEEFPVAWNLTGISQESFANEGDIVSIPGTVTTVFNETFPVTASIRVAAPIAGEKVNIAPAYLTLTESCSKPSDSLLSITNGTKYSHPNAQAERWTNWNNMSDADNPVITFTWATAHLVDEFRLFFYTDATASCQALSKTVEGVRFEYSVDGTTWESIGYNPAMEVIPDVNAANDKDKIINGRIYKLNNSINPIAIRITIGHDKGKFVGLSEVEVMSTSFSYESNTSADLSSISVNGTAIEDFDPAVTNYTIDEAYTEAPSIGAASDSNASCSILPMYGKMVRIFTLSEDGSASKMYTLHFDKADDSIKIKNISGKADSEQSAKDPQPASNAVDGDTETHWHSNWTNKDVVIDLTDPEKCINNGYTMDLGAIYAVNKLEYLPRQGESNLDNGNANGRIARYRLLYSATDNPDDFQEITLSATDPWTDDSTLKTAVFDSVEARYLRIEALQTYGVTPANNNLFVNAAEFYVYREAAFDCICEINNLVFSNRQVQIPYNEDTLAYPLNAYAEVNQGCIVDGHESPKLQYVYEILEDNDNIAELADNVLTFNAEGSVTVKTTAKLMDSNNNLITETSATATFTASKEQAPVEFTLDFTGGENASGTAPAPISGKAGAKVTLPVNSFTKEGYDFAGWSDGTVIYDENAEYTIGSANVTFTATWEKTEIPSSKIEGITGKADSEQSAKDPQPAANAMDGNTDTHWHSNWTNNDIVINPEDPEQCINNGYTIDLGGKYEITKLEYLPRQGEATSENGIGNGRISKYRLLYSLTGNADDFHEITPHNSTPWGDTSDLKIATFDPLETRFIRIEALETYGAGTQKNKFISAAEFYVYKTEGSEPIPVCTCTLSDLQFSGSNTQIPSNASDTKITLNASATLGGSCKIPGHAGAAIHYTYNVESDPDKIVSAQNDNILTVNKAGNITVKATASVNDKNVSKTANFKVTKEAEEVTYTISFTGGNGAAGNAPQDIVAKEGTNITLPENTFTKEGYLFKGWNDGAKVYPEKASYTVGNKNVTFTAVWEEEIIPTPDYTISFTGGTDAGGNAPQNIVAKEGTNITLPENTFTKEGYLFKGWNDGTKVYPEKASYTVGNKNVTFTAVWEKQEAPVPAPVKVSQIKLKTDSKDMAATKKATVKATVLPANAANKNVIWRSSNTKYATVNSKGIVSFKKSGGGKTVVITATAADGSGVNASLKFTIRKNAVQKINLNVPKKTVKAGNRMKINAAIKPGKYVNKKLTWKIKNPKYASISSKGILKAKKAGKGKTVTIFAYATDGSKKKGTIKIRIK